MNDVEMGDAKGNQKKDNQRTSEGDKHNVFDVRYCDISLKPIPQAKRDQFSERDFAKQELTFKTYCGADGLVPEYGIHFVLEAAEENMSDDRVMECMKQYKNGLDFEAYLDKILDQRRTAHEELIQAFKSFDTGNKGYIDLNDLKKLHAMLGEKKTDEELQYIMAESDSDGDGVLNFGDFLGVMNAH